MEPQLFAQVELTTLHPSTLQVTMTKDDESCSPGFACLRHPCKLLTHDDVLDMALGNTINDLSLLTSPPSSGYFSAEKLYPESCPSFLATPMSGYVSDTELDELLFMLEDVEQHQPNLDVPSLRNHATFEKCSEIFPLDSLDFLLMSSPGVQSLTTNHVLVSCDLHPADSRKRKAETEGQEHSSPPTKKRRVRRAIFPQDMPLDGLLSEDDGVKLLDDSRSV